MDKLCLFLILAIVSQEALGMSYRYKRQNQDDKNNGDGDLEDRYGWSWGNPGRFPRPQAPWRPNPNMFPNPYPYPNMFPNPIPRPTPVPNRPTPGQTQPTTSTASPNVNGQPANLQACRRSCLTTSEYNPVCGTNGVDYDNPSRLYCDQGCGVNVSILRTAKCPTANPTPTA